MEPDRLHTQRESRGSDLEISHGGWNFVVEYLNSASVGVLSAAVEQLMNRHNTEPVLGIPTLAVPYMGNVGREICLNAGVSWLDLSGNAHITGPGLRIIIEGRANKFRQLGRPTNLFAPRSSRIARHLLLNPRQFQTQIEIARATRLDDGYVSKLVRRFKQEQFVIEDERGAIRPRDPDVLLDAWQDAYDFKKHHIIKGHVSARSGESLLDSLAIVLDKQKVGFAATGLSAAWLWTKFAGFRIATIYLHEEPTQDLLSDLKFVEEESGANTWLVIPNDDGVFDGSKKLPDIPCVSALQVYLDLQSHPERAKEAATSIRQRYLNWKTRA